MAKTVAETKVQRNSKKTPKQIRRDFIQRVQDEIKANQKSNKTLVWYQSKIKQVLGHTPVRSDVESLDRQRKKHYTGIIPGRIYFYGYDAKYKKTLPYYDRFPLVIILDISKDHILGLNLHYIPYKFRLIFIEKLEEFVVNSGKDDREKFALTYGLVKNFAKFPEVAPMIKKYIKSRVEGRLIEIIPSELITAALLPVASFSNGNQLKVWADSLEKMGI